MAFLEHFVGSPEEPALGIQDFAYASIVLGQLSLLAWSDRLVVVVAGVLWEALHLFVASVLALLKGLSGAA